MPGVLHRLRGSSSAPIVATFLALLAWSTYAYLVERVNADIVAEAIAVQSLVREPAWTLSYPGQLHGGVLEYPLIALAESFSAGNVYAFTAVRILYVPLAGALIAMSLRLAWLRWPLWWLAATAAAGPAILHGPKLVSDLYPSSFLLAALGTWLAYRALARSAGPWALAGAGLVLGLATYQHASAAMIAAPFAIAAWARWRVPVRRMAALGAGYAAGLLPLLLAFTTQPSKPIVFSPADPGLPDALGVLGLRLDVDAWRRAIAPNGFGLVHADQALGGLPWAAQAGVHLSLAAGLAAFAVAGVRGLLAMRRGAGPSMPAFAGILALTGTLSALVITSVVPPVWFYGSALAPVAWACVSVLPAALPAAGRWIAAAAILLTAAVSASAVLAQQPAFVEGARFKLGQARYVEQVAAAIQRSGLTYVYGDYWEVLPIAYASGGSLTPLTSSFDRFGARDALPGERVNVAVAMGYTALPERLERWTTSASVESLVREACRPLPETQDGLPAWIEAFDCPVAALRVDVVPGS